ncbi:Rpoc1p, partial [Datura stramonium]|nr:Rpoc1p [Datura stramonium]
SSSLIRQHLSSNIGVAESKIREKEPIVWEILREVMQGHPADSTNKDKVLDIRFGTALAARTET